MISIPRKTLLQTGFMVCLGLSLTACQTTSSTQATSGSSAELSKIDTVLARAAYDAQSRGKVEESLELLENMYKRNSADVEIAIRYARALRYAGRYQRAALVLSPSVNNFADHNNAHVLIEYSALHSAMGKYADAEEYALQAISENPDIPKAYHVLGVAQDAQGNHIDAEKAFRKALDNWAGDPSSLLNNLGLNLAAQGEVEEAIAILEKASAAAPNRIEIERNLRIVNALRNTPFQGEEKPAPVPVEKPDEDSKKVKEKAKADKDAPVKLDKPVEKAEADDTNTESDSEEDSDVQADDVQTEEKRSFKPKGLSFND